MPTYATSTHFDNEYRRLDDERSRRFRVVLRLFIRALQDWERKGCVGDPEFPPSLRAKKMRGHPCWEMSWDEDGRSTWRYGAAERPGKAHIEWYRIGDHSILRDPMR
jgi:hypothetical protein